MQKEQIIQKLREQGCRITKQRQILLDIILEEDCSCCKEIYYKASKLDKKIGTATVYRMINTLEEIGAIDRKNMYRISEETDEVEAGGQSTVKECEGIRGCTVELDDGKALELSGKDWNNIVQSGLMACGYVRSQKVKSVVVKTCKCGE